MYSLVIVQYLVLHFVLKSEQKCLATNDNVCDSLQDLYVYNNYLGTDLTVRNNNSFETLKVVNNENAKLVERLVLSSSLKKIESKAFQQFENLKILVFEKNKLEVITGDWFVNPKLEVLSFYENNVQRIGEGAFSNLTRLDVLRLTKNNLTEIKRGVFNGMNINTLALQDSKILTINKLAFGNMAKLKKLFLNDNYLTEFNVQNYVTNTNNLEKLWLHGNNITEITQYMLEGLSSLDVLNLGFNRISVIESESFKGTPSLRCLVLTHNLLTTIDGSVLPILGLRKLEILYLSHNKLMHLSSNFLFKLNLKSITIGGNPWKCPCLDLLLRWLNDNDVHVNCDKTYFNGEKPICIPTNSSVCVYSYNENLYRQFQSVHKLYPPEPLCLL